MKQSWPLTIAVLAILAVPFGIAMFEDATGEAPEPDAAAPAADVAAQPESATIPEADEGDSEVAFDRRADIDFSFLDELSDGEPGLGPGLARVAALGEAPADAPAVAAYRERFARARGEEPVELLIDADPEAPGGAVAAVTFRFPPAPAIRQILRRKWGSPDVAGFSGSVWLDPAARVRAALIEEPGRWRLQLSRYRPLAEMLERRGDGSFALEPSGLLGAGAPDAPRLVADGDLTKIYVDAPPASAQPSTPITLVRESGRVSDVSITVDLSLDPEAQRVVRRALEGELGKPRAENIGDAVQLIFDADPWLSVFLYDDRLVIDRRRARR